MEDNILVQELNDYIKANHLGPMNKLVLRVAKNNLIINLQTQQDIQSIKKYNDKCKKSPSLSMMFKDAPIKVALAVVSLGAVLFTIYYVIVTVLGLEVLLKAAIP